MPKSDENTIDLNFRPKSYFWPHSFETHLLSTIKGAKRRLYVQELFKTGRRDEIIDWVAQASLSEADRKYIGRLHPALMGGEFLPDAAEQEIEIARISIESTTADVTSVYARRGKGRIYYRVVDEYEGDTLVQPTSRTSRQPLTLCQLVTFFDKAWPLLPVLRMNFDNDLDAMLAFFKATSSFYPQIDALYRQRVNEGMARR